MSQIRGGSSTNFAAHATDPGGIRPSKAKSSSWTGRVGLGTRLWPVPSRPP